MKPRTWTETRPLSNDPAISNHAIVRTNTGGVWSTSDDYTGPTGDCQCWYNAFAADPISGALYAGGEELTNDNWIIRAALGPARQ